MQHQRRPSSVVNSRVIDIRAYQTETKSAPVSAMTTPWLLLLGVLSGVCARSHDPWGENVQPNLHTDYLNQLSGKPNFDTYHDFVVANPIAAPSLSLTEHAPPNTIIYFKGTLYKRVRTTTV